MLSIYKVIDLTLIQVFAAFYMCPVGGYLQLIPSIDPFSWSVTARGMPRTCLAPAVSRDLLSSYSPPPEGQWREAVTGYRLAMSLSGVWKYVNPRTFGCVLCWMPVPIPSRHGEVIERVCRSAVLGIRHPARALCLSCHTNHCSRLPLFRLLSVSGDSAYWSAYSSLVMHTGVGEWKLFWLHSWA